MQIGVLTGGGDCPGLNAAIRAIVRKALADGHAVIGLRYGWAGLLNDDTAELTLQNTAGILPRGGTILGTSRTNPFAEGAGEDALDAMRRTIALNGLDALIAIGGEDTLGVAARLQHELIPVVGVPKTIDNDLACTDVTIGFDTAVQIAAEAIDRLHTTAESHNRVMVVEVMGRHAGWIATYAGIASGGDAILVPERPFEIEEVCSHLRSRHARGRDFSIVVAAEGATPAASDAEGAKPENRGDEGATSTAGKGEGARPADEDEGVTPTTGEGEGARPAAGGGEGARPVIKDAFGHERLGGIGFVLAQQIEARTGFETRVTILGHVQRGGVPTAFDRVLATRYGIAAVEAASARRFGVMVGLNGGSIEEVDLDLALREPKLLDPRLYDTAATFFG